MGENSNKLLKPMNYNEFNNDQRREFINTQQRFVTWRDLHARLRETRGSMVWAQSKGIEYLARSYYEKSGVRKQASLGPRSERTERMKLEFERGRDDIQQRFKQIDAAMDRQAAVNRVLGLGRVPLIGARILRAVEQTQTLGAGLRVVGTNAIFAYEAAAGVMVDPGLTATGDIDFLMDSRGGLKFVVSDEISERSLIKTLRSVDKSFEITKQPYRAQNAQGYMVDLTHTGARWYCPRFQWQFPASRDVHRSRFQTGTGRRHDLYAGAADPTSGDDLATGCTGAGNRRAGYRAGMGPSGP